MNLIENKWLLEFFEKNNIDIEINTNFGEKDLLIEFCKILPINLKKLTIINFDFN